MKYPSRSDYCSSVRNPQFAFRKKDPRTQIERDLDSSLVTGKPIEKIRFDGVKDVWSASGSCAIVFKYETFSPKKTWAIRCFYRSDFEVIEHYKKSLNYLKNHPCKSYFINFSLLEEGVRVLGECYPILKMEWVEGENLKKFIKANLNNKNKLQSLAESWLKLSQDFLKGGVAHGDLQHGNVSIANHFNRLDLKLIDYDSLYFAGDRRGIEDRIKGLSDYQHPLRKSLNKKCLEIDFFPQLVIYLSLLALAEDKQLWHTYQVEIREGLLFSQADFLDPDRANIFRSLFRLPAPIPALAHKLKKICQLKDFSKIPSLEAVLSDDRPIEIDAIADVASAHKNTSPTFINPVFLWQKGKDWFSRHTHQPSQKEFPASSFNGDRQPDDRTERELETVIVPSPQPQPVPSDIHPLEHLSEKHLEWDPRSYKITHQTAIAPENASESADVKILIEKKADDLRHWIDKTKGDVLQTYQSTRTKVAGQFEEIHSQFVNPIPAIATKIKDITKPKTWTTREVASQLSRSPRWCHTQRYQNPDLFCVGTHYHKDEEGIIQWTKAGIKQLNRLLQARSTQKTDPPPATTLPTKAVSHQLGVTSECVTLTRAKYATQFVEGVHYHIDNRRRYYWTPAGIDRLQQLLTERAAKSSRTKAKSRTMTKKSAKSKPQKAT